MIQTLDLKMQRGSSQRTRIRHRSLRYADQYEQRNYDDRLRSVFESWSVKVNGLSYSQASELDEFLNAHRGEMPFKWDDGECIDIGNGGGSWDDGTGDHSEHFYKCDEWEFEYLVGLADGVDECMNGVVNFSATFNQCYGIYIADDYTLPQATLTHSIKAIWFTRQYDIYLGGDRPDPVLIDSLPDGVTNVEVFISNTGLELNDYIAGIKYREPNQQLWTIRTLYGNDPSRNWTLTTDYNFTAFRNQIPGRSSVAFNHNPLELIYWRGCGLWASSHWIFRFNTGNDQYAQLLHWSTWDGQLRMSQGPAVHRVAPNRPEVNMYVIFDAAPGVQRTYRVRCKEGVDYQVGFPEENLGEYWNEVGVADLSQGIYFYKDSYDGKDESEYRFYDSNKGQTFALANNINYVAHPKTTIKRVNDDLAVFYRISDNQNSGVPSASQSTDLSLLVVGANLPHGTSAVTFIQRLLYPLAGAMTDADGNLSNFALSYYPGSADADYPIP